MEGKVLSVFIKQKEGTKALCVASDLQKLYTVDSEEVCKDNIELFLSCVDKIMKSSLSHHFSQSL